MSLMLLRHISVADVKLVELHKVGGNGVQAP